MKEPLLYRLIRPLISLLFKVLYHPRYIGLENIPQSGPYVLSGNHTNYLDCLLLMSINKKVIHFLAKNSLMQGFKKVIFKNMGIIPVNRRIHDKGALNEAINHLKANHIIGIFPEGTINRTNDIIMPFKIGTVKMAYETNSYIVPFVITGKYQLFKGHITIEFLKPYRPLSSDLTAENEILMNLIKNKLLEKRK